jgi:hypothetical protein
MTAESTKSRGLMGKMFRVLLTGGVVVLTLLVAAHFAWKYSGSNQWEKAIEKDGVTVYTLKAPGDTVIRVKGITQAKSTLNGAVASMMQTSSEECRTWFPGCTSVATVQPWNPKDLTYVQLFRLTAFKPFAPRETLLRARASQNAATKAVLIEFTASPDELPLNSCCYRVAHMQNSWRFTPLGNGTIQVENRMNVDFRLPYVMFNRFMPRGLHRQLTRIQKHLARPEWAQAKYQGIEEQF